MPVTPVYSYHYGPMSDEARSALAGLFILVNLIMVVCNIIGIIWALRNKESIKETLFSVMSELGWLYGINLMIGLIDGLVLLMVIGRLIGKLLNL